MRNGLSENFTDNCGQIKLRDLEITPLRSHNVHALSSPFMEGSGRVHPFLQISILSGKTERAAVEGTATS